MWVLVSGYDEFIKPDVSTICVGMAAIGRRSSCWREGALSGA